MSHTDFLSFFVTVALKPHSQCVNPIRPASFRFLRYASTHSSKPTSIAAGFRASQKVRNAATASSTARPQIPLHLGLDRNPEHVSAISRIPIPKGERGEQFVPSVLARPLGLEYPPRPGQNSPVDKRTWNEKKEEFTSVDKAMERRRVYLRSFLRPYFQEWKRVDYWKGKSFVSNDRLFRKDKALYFPNIWGQTLASNGNASDGGRDTTDILMGKISIVGIQSGQWAEEQVDTFLSPKHNAQLQDIIDNSKGRVQRADVNIQGDWLRMLLVNLFTNRLKKNVPEERWKRYFLVKLPRDIRKGLTEDVRDAMGLLNSHVGYVYLLDAACKIRWAGSGHAWKGEVEGLNAAIKRLMQEESST